MIGLALCIGREDGVGHAADVRRINESSRCQGNVPFLHRDG